MAVALKFPECRSCLSSPARKSRSGRALDREDTSANELVIGLLNNMSDGALEATERQFLSLLNAAGKELDVQLSYYSIPEVPRGEAARRHMDGRYFSVDSLWNSKLDGLIVTGREPLFADLREEPYWNSFVRVHEWARENTFSTIWSCLAAHAAVLHKDGIGRQKSQRKHYGVFECVQVSTHPMMANIPSTFRLPHSRWNGLAHSHLAQSGYQILTQAEGAGVDCFIKEESSLFVYFQGHPEYESDTLLLEYRRDVSRYLNGDISTYPSLPRGYFGQETERELMRVQSEADTKPHKETLALVAAAASSFEKENCWRTTASTLYSNWLIEIQTKKRAKVPGVNAVFADDMSALSTPMTSSRVDPMEHPVAL
jgi:homoserine O-succinyltransferase/O-acetyltransferase